MSFKIQEIRKKFIKLMHNTIERSSNEYYSNFKTYLIEELKQMGLFKFEICHRFYEKRKYFLKILQIEKKRDILLDPELLLHTLPSADIILLDIPETLSNKIQNKELTPPNCR